MFTSNLHFLKRNGLIRHRKWCAVWQRRYKFQFALIVELTSKSEELKGTFVGLERGLNDVGLRVPPDCVFSIMMSNVSRCGYIVENLDSSLSLGTMNLNIRLQ